MNYMRPKGMKTSRECWKVKEIKKKTDAGE